MTYKPTKRESVLINKCEALPSAAHTIDSHLSSGKVAVSGGREIRAEDGTLLCGITVGHLSAHQTDTLAKFIAHLLNGGR